MRSFKFSFSLFWLSSPLLPPRLPLQNLNQRLSHNMHSNILQHSHRSIMELTKYRNSQPLTRVPTSLFHRLSPDSTTTSQPDTHTTEPTVIQLDIFIKGTNINKQLSQYFDCNKYTTSLEFPQIFI